MSAGRLVGKLKMNNNNGTGVEASHERKVLLLAALALLCANSE